MRRGDVLEVIAVSGPDLVEMLGTTLPVGVLEGELDRADVWGDLRFVPHERVGDEVLEYSHVLDILPVDHPDGWHPLDLLVAPLYDDEGTLRGLLAVDAPDDGRRPGPRQREVLARYARVARSYVLLGARARAAGGAGAARDRGPGPGAPRAGRAVAQPGDRGLSLGRRLRLRRGGHVALGPRLRW